MEEIMPNRLDRSFFKYQAAFEQKALSVLRSGWYVLGQEVLAFEQEFASFTGASYCVGLASGLDALVLAFRILGIGPGDEVIVPGNTFIASVMGITQNGATPIFVEPDEFFNIDVAAIEAKITHRTRAILVVHLYGQAANMGKICELSTRHGLRLVEDCAQSHGASFNGQMTGTFGDIGCFSFYPSKNMGAFGDAGAIVTNQKQIAQDCRMYRNYGSEKRYHNRVIGMNSRLDELQAGLLRVRLEHLAEMTADRVAIAERYGKGLHNDRIIKPLVRLNATSVWHQYVIRCHERDRLQRYLSEHQVGTIIHYPIPPHLSEAYQYLGWPAGSFPTTEQYANEVLSLPMYNGMTDEEQEYVIDVVNQFQ